MNRGQQDFGAFGNQNNQFPSNFRSYDGIYQVKEDHIKANQAQQEYLKEVLPEHTD